MAVKTCSKCKESKDLTDFDARNDAPDGRKGVCSLCCRGRARAAYWTKKEARTDARVHDYGVGKIPEGFGLKGISQYLDGEGKVRGQWVKTAADKGLQAEILLAAITEVMEDYTGIVEPAAVPVHCDSDLINVIPLGDPHIGLHCWGEEVGADFNLKIAAENMRVAVRAVFDAAPAAKQCLLINLGDYFHADKADNKTTAGTPVDVDGRRVKVVRTGVQIFIDMIDQALLKHEHVTVICATGNHDGDSSKMLTIMLELMYQRESRVTIVVAPTKFHKFRFGRCLFGVTHGDTGKAADLPLIMACDWKGDWAETEYRHWYTGHVHHDSVKEMPGCIVETFRTLAPGDAWHNAQGYRSGRDIKCDTWHREYGHLQRNKIGISRIGELVQEGRKRDATG